MRVYLDAPLFHPLSERRLMKMFVIQRYALSFSLTALSPASTLGPQSLKASILQFLRVQQSPDVSSYGSFPFPPFIDLVFIVDDV